jgi:hypothetical protein
MKMLEYYNTWGYSDTLSHQSNYFDYVCLNLLSAAKDIIHAKIIIDFFFVSILLGWNSKFGYISTLYETFIFLTTADISFYFY